MLKSKQYKVIVFKDAYGDKPTLLFEKYVPKSLASLLIRFVDILASKSTDEYTVFIGPVHDGSPNEEFEVLLEAQLTLKATKQLKFYIDFNLPSTFRGN